MYRIPVVQLHMTNSNWALLLLTKQKLNELHGRIQQKLPKPSQMLTFQYTSQFIGKQNWLTSIYDQTVKSVKWNTIIKLNKRLQGQSGSLGCNVTLYQLPVCVCASQKWAILESKKNQSYILSPNTYTISLGHIPLNTWKILQLWPFMQRNKKRKR